MSTRIPTKAVEFSVVRFGGRTRLIESTVVITTAGTERVAINNPDRIQLTIVNAGTDLVTLRTSRPVVSGVGIRLGPGNTVTFVLEEDAETTGWEVFGVAASGSQTLFVSEVVVE